MGIWCNAKAVPATVSLFAPCVWNFLKLQIHCPDFSEWEGIKKMQARRPAVMKKLIY